MKVTRAPHPYLFAGSRPQLIKFRDKKVSPARGRGVVITLVMATSIITKPAAILMDIARVIY